MTMEKTQPGSKRLRSVAYNPNIHHLKVGELTH